MIPFSHSSPTEQPCDDAHGAIKRLTSILSHMHTAFATFDSFGQCTYCSPVLHELLGSQPKDIEDFVAALSNEPDTQYHLLRSFESSRNGENKPRVNVRRKNRNGIEHTFSINTFLLGNETNAEQAVILQDSSKDIDTHQDLEQISRLAALGEITAGVAHEVNNIVTAMLGWTQIASENKDDSSILSSALQVVDNNAQRIRDISSRLLGVSRPKGNTHLQISLTGIIDEILGLLAWELRDKDIKIVRSFDHENDICWGDDNRISQVFINIMRNAMDAMPKGGTLRIVVKKKGNQVEASFIDTGDGMSPDVLKRIFDPFFTTKASTDDPSHGGTGLGMTLCQKIMEQHAGKIEVESAKGKGTRFGVVLPAAAREPEPLQNGTARSTIPPGITVLVVDDEPDIGEMVRVSLELKGAKVSFANNGKDAVAQCSKKPFDVAFVDFSMPGLSGHDLGQEIHNSRPDMPIIFMSGREIEVDKDSPIADFIKKPFDLDDIQAKLCEVLKNR